MLFLKSYDHLYPDLHYQLYLGELGALVFRNAARTLLVPNPSVCLIHTDICVGVIYTQ